MIDIHELSKLSTLDMQKAVLDDLSSLSIVCVTNNAHPHVERFIQNMNWLAALLGAEFVLGLDREKAKTSNLRKYATKALNLTADKLQEDVLDQAIAACSGEWVLRLDDDERISDSLLTWLMTGAYTSGRLYAFPCVYPYPDTNHILANPGMWPDLHTRLGRKELMFGVNHVHAGNPHGTGQVVPYAMEHHNLLVKTLEERRAKAALYESIRPGAGTLPEYVRYSLPEDFYPEFIIHDYTNGDYSK
jgi:hypothetical protein